MNNLLKLIALSLLIIISSCRSDRDEIPKIPVEDFFKNPEQTNLQLSPDGEYISFFKPWQNRLNIFVKKVDSPDTIQLTRYTDRNVHAYRWVNNNRIVFVKDEGGDQFYKLFSIDKNGNGLIQLTSSGHSTVGLIDPLINDDKHILVSINERNEEVFDVYRLDIETGDKKMIAKNPGNIIEWLTDHDGKLRIAVTTDGVNHGLLYRDTEQDEFELIYATNFKESFYPLLFTFDNKNLYVASNINRDKLALVEYDIENNVEVNTIYENPEVDIDDIHYSNERQTLTAVSYITWKTEYEYLDNDRLNLQQTLEAKVPGKEVSIPSMSRDETKMLVRTYSDKSLGSYYFYNRTTDEFKKVADISPWLKEKYMANMKPVWYKSRDGLTINGYLILPKNKEPEKLPVVVFPHGGPWTRDSWGFCADCQFLANRGYAVFQINYRGSYGYGREFWTAGFKEWGGKMQDDITDGVYWLIKQGIADPSEISIYGYSFGGYCALMGLIQHPDLYKCGVSNSGLVDVLDFFDNIPPYWTPFKEMLYEMVGNENTEKDFLREISPLHNIDKIKDPVLFAQGQNDQQVNVNSTTKMVENLKERGIPVKYILKDNEGHGFANEENKIEFYNTLEKFLAKYQKGKIQLGN